MVNHLSTKQFTNRIIRLTHGTYLPIETYRGFQQAIYFKHLVCGGVFKQQPASFRTMYKKGMGCNQCSLRPGYIKVHCKAHRHVYQIPIMELPNFKRYGHECPICKKLAYWDKYYPISLHVDTKQLTMVNSFTSIINEFVKE